MFSQIFKIGVSVWAASLFAVNPASVDYVNQQVAILQTEIDNIPPGQTYTAGSGISITDNVISATGGTTYTIGEYAQGGVVFYLDRSNQHGLVAAIVDQDGGSGVQWYNGSNLTTAAYGNGVYLGAQNTTQIIAIQGAGTYAATDAANYSVTVGGVTYTGWYLPSQIELALMFMLASTINTTAEAHGGTAFASASYWSSFEGNSNGTAWGQSFSTGVQGNIGKSAAEGVRAIRAF